MNVGLGWFVEFSLFIEGDSGPLRWSFQIKKITVMAGKSVIL